MSHQEPPGVTACLTSSAGGGSRSRPMQRVRRLLLLSAVLVVEALPAAAQSARSGWGATPYHDAGGAGTTFRVWAPHATAVSAAGQWNNWSTTAAPLAKETTNGAWTGVWSADIPGAAAGQQYKFVIQSAAGTFWKHDPRARVMTRSGSAAGANDIIYDPAAFDWMGDAFAAPAERDLVVYELHVGTFGPAGASSRFAAAAEQLDYLADLGVTAVELLPVSEFPETASWGYDLVQPFSVRRQGYGGPDALKSFVQACHAHGLAVLIDVVHNHYGPTDLDLWDFDGWTGTGPIGGGIYFNTANTNQQITPYGATRPNTTEPRVAQYIVDNIAMWLREYHVDGFRWDTPNLLINAGNFGYIPAAGDVLNRANALLHTKVAPKISIAEDVYDAFGFDSAWDTSFPYALTPVLAAATDAARDVGAAANAVLNNVRYGGKAGLGRVTFLESHDVTGDLNNGSRLAASVAPTAPGGWKARKLSLLGEAVAVTAPGIPMLFQGQEMLENLPFSANRLVDWSKTNTYAGVVQGYRDLLWARRNRNSWTPGLGGDSCEILLADNAAKVLAFRRWDAAAPGSDTVVVANFSGSTLEARSIPFPAAGNWYTQLNTDAPTYSSDFGGAGSTTVTATGAPASGRVTIGPYSALILSRIPEVPPTLEAMTTAGSVTITWPDGYADWVLESADSPEAAAWTLVEPSGYGRSGGIVKAQVGTNGEAYFRLRR
jgi:1,4-alpha-glucan branching enzyme